MIINERIREMIDKEIPEHLREGLKRYYFKGVMPGSFLRAVLENDLKGAFSSGDSESLDHLEEIVIFLYNYLPMDSWGSKKIVQDWIKFRKAQGERRCK